MSDKPDEIEKLKGENARLRADLKRLRDQLKRTEAERDMLLNDVRKQFEHHREKSIEILNLLTENEELRAKVAELEEKL